MENTKDKINENVARKIWHEALQCSVKPLTWNIDFCCVRTIKYGTAFHVKAAWIYIQYVSMTGSYKLTIIPDDKQKSRIVYESLLLENLVSTIDDALTNGLILQEPVYNTSGIVSERIAV